MSIKSIPRWLGLGAVLVWGLCSAAEARAQFHVNVDLGRHPGLAEEEDQPAGLPQQRAALHAGHHGQVVGPGARRRLDGTGQHIRPHPDVGVGEQDPLPGRGLRLSELRALNKVEPEAMPARVRVLRNLLERKLKIKVRDEHRLILGPANTSTATLINFSNDGLNSPSSKQA